MPDPAAPDPIRRTDDDARALARSLIEDARHGALGVIDPATGGPHVTRVAVGHDGAAPLILVSLLAHHARALAMRPACSLLLGEPGPRGDPLTHPRLTLTGRTVAADKARAREEWLRDHPKARLYYDFADFQVLRIEVEAAHLNGGFGRAYRLGPSDLRAPRTPP